MHVCLNFNIKNAGFVFAVEICDFSVFAYNFYSFNKYIVVELKFCIEKPKNACRKLLNLRNKPEKNTAFSFSTRLIKSYTGKKFDRGKF